MGFASSQEDNEKRSDDARAMDGASHPTILASRARPIQKTADPKVVRRKLKERARFAAKTAAKKSAQEKQVLAHKKIADSALVKVNDRLLKHVKFLEDLVKRQAEEIKTLRKK